MAQEKTTGTTTGTSSADEMTVSELAERVGMTARNIRAYQSRGLLQPPHIQGRTACYSGIHTARLLLVASLRSEGFTLGAIGHLLSNLGDYSAIVAERRRRIRDGDVVIAGTVLVSAARIRAAFPGLPEDLTETGLVWRDDTGRLVSHTALVGIARTLLDRGLPADVVAALQLDAVRAGQASGDLLREHSDNEHSDNEHSDNEHSDNDLAKVAAQLASVAFEIGFLRAATGDPNPNPNPS